MIRRRIPETRDPDIYAPWETETAWIEAYTPPPNVECVWCGAKIEGAEWTSHQLSAHFEECVSSWVRGLAPLKADVRWKSHAARIKYAWNERMRRA